VFDAAALAITLTFTFRCLDEPEKCFSECGDPTVSYHYTFNYTPENCGELFKMKSITLISENRS